MELPFLRRCSDVRQIPIFSRLNWFDLQRIAWHVTVVPYRKGEIIRRQGDPADALYCLLSGRIQGYLWENNRKTHVEFFRRGNYFGVVSLLTGEMHSLTFEAINDSVVLLIDKRFFQKMIRSIPRLGLEFSHTLSQRIRRRLYQRDQSSESMIIAVYSPLRGTGASTFAVNFALALGRSSRQGVIMVDFVATAGLQDRQAQKPSSLRWRKSPVPLDEVVSELDNIGRYVVKGGPPADFLNVGCNPGDPSLVDLISHFVTSLSMHYRFVVVDLPTEMDSVVLKTLGQADRIVLLTKADRQEDARTARAVIDKIEEELKENFQPENVFLLLSGKESEARRSLEEISTSLDFEVTGRLPHLAETDLSQDLATPDFSVRLPDAQNSYTQTVTALARKVSGAQIGLVLGGGAAFGLAHIGVLRVLERENIPVDVVVGSSMGALIASLWVTGQDSGGIEKLAQEFRDRRSLWKLFDPVVPIAGIIGGKMIKHWLTSRHLGEKTFYDTKVPLKIVAYDLAKRSEIVINKGLLVEAVRKSIAIPGLIEPVLESEQVIIDGGVLNPLPTNVMRDAGVKKMIAVNVLQSPGDVARGYAKESDRVRQEQELSFRQAPLKYLKTRFRLGNKKRPSPNISDIIVRSLLASEYLIAERNAELADVVVHPDLSEVNWYELYKVDELIRRGEVAAEAALPQIRRLCEL